MMRRVAPTLRWRALTRASSAAGWRRGRRAVSTSEGEGGGSALVCARSARAVLKRGHGVRVGARSDARRRDRGARRRVRRGGRARSEPEACAVQHAWRCLGGHALDRRAVQDARRASERVRALRGCGCARAARVRGRDSLGALSERQCGASGWSIGELDGAQRLGAAHTDPKRRGS